MDVVAGLTKKCISDNASVAQNQEEYNRRYNSYVDRYEKAKVEYDRLTDVREERLAKRRAIERFLRELRKRADLITVFDPVLWLTCIDRVTVHTDGTLVFRFTNGTEIRG